MKENNKPAWLCDYSAVQPQLTGIHTPKPVLDHVWQVRKLGVYNYVGIARSRFIPNSIQRGDS